METNQQQPSKTTMSLGAVLEMIFSLFVLITLFIPACSYELGFSITGLSGGDVVGETRLISFYNMYEDRDWLYYLVFALPVANFIAKIFRRTSWLSALMLYSAAMPIMLADELASDPTGFFVSQPLWGYYWAWFNVYGIAISVFISWLISFGKKFRYYKLLFILSGIFVVLGATVAYLYDRAIYLSDEELEGMKIAFLSCAILGVLSLTEAFISLGFNYKKKRRKEVLAVEESSEVSVLGGTASDDSLQ